ncbi:alkaline phosphatase family protein [Filimonas effusa]|uniref:Alkaline phosphatase family protein n=2 Tax=Filimonas effusa TaxID=2508721 RepID=A0A4Q1DEW7_9BACT|nr:alkaline phosphatase family protein [Filimonas effusa]
MAHGQRDSLQHITEGRKNSAAAQQQPYVILISADGFRYDYAEKYNAQHLIALGEKGVRASSMIPSYPSVTFSNHYTLVTGLYPSHHGLVSNYYYDRARNTSYAMHDKVKVRDGSWYGGTPLWVLAEQQQTLSASMFWVGSEAAIQDTRPTYYYDYNEGIPVNRRIGIVKEWLSLPEDRRPHFITFYVSEPDHAGHHYGPDAEETRHAVLSVDSIVYNLTQAVASTGLPVNFIFVADHGMTAVNREQPLKLPEGIDTSKFMVSSSGTTLMLYGKSKTDIRRLYKALKKADKPENHYKIYRKQDMPAHLHYGEKDDRFDRIGDILLLPEWPYVFANKKPNPGYHGFDPTVVKDMHAIFMAWGPAFKQHLKIPSFENVNVYPLVAQILDLKITSPIDGSIKTLQNVLNTAP